MARPSGPLGPDRALGRGENYPAIGQVNFALPPHPPTKTQINPCLCKIEAKDLAFDIPSGGRKAWFRGGGGGGGMAARSSAATEKSLR